MGQVLGICNRGESRGATKNGIDSKHLNITALVQIPASLIIRVTLDKIIHFSVP